MKNEYQVIVVGAGSGGLTVALGLAAAGKKVALIEGGPIGGDCTNFGCVPSKALIDIAKENSPFSKGSPGGTKGRDFVSALQEVRSRRQVIQDEETVEKIESHGLKVVQGYASFVDEHTLEIIPPHLPLKKGEIATKISGDIIVLATGSHAMKLEIEGVDTDDILTNEEIFEQTEDIKNLIVIGGGYIGCELAESIASFGVTTHIVQRNTALVPREEQESSKLLQEIFQKKGIFVHTGANIVSADPESSSGGQSISSGGQSISSGGQGSKNKKLLITDSYKKETAIAYDKILIALGRVPNVEKLKLESIGVNYDTKGIFVDRYNRTNKKHIFAIGDCVNGNPQFTHWANNEGRGVVRNILFPYKKSSLRNMTLPAVLYTHLEIARVGKTREELLKSYSTEDIITKTLDFSENDRSKVTQDTKGFIKIHFKRISGKILGATIYGKGAGEMISQITLAMDNNISAYKIAKTIQPYPTKSDLIKRVANQFVVETLGNFKKEAQYFLRSNILQILTGGIWIILAISFFVYKGNTGQTFEQIAITLYNFLGNNPAGVLLFVGAYALRPIILFPATLMTFMAGALFGAMVGVGVTVIGATLSALTAYVIGAIFGKKMISSDNTGFIGELKTSVNASPFTSILMTRLLFFPYDLTNYASGFLRVKIPSFILATLIGIIPGTAVFVLAGSAFEGEKITSFSEAISGIDVTMLYYAAGLFVLTLLFAKFLKKVTK